MADKWQLTVDERLRNLMSLQEFAEELQKGLRKKDGHKLP